MVSAIDLSDEQIQQAVLDRIAKANTIADTADFVQELKITPKIMDAALKSLNVDEYVDLEVIDLKLIELTKEGAGYLVDGTPEFQYASALTFGVETPKADVEKKVGKNIAKIGFQKAMSAKWVQLCGDKKQNVKRVAETLVDTDKAELAKFKADTNLDSHDKKLVDAFKKRKLIATQTIKSYKVTKGKSFAPVRAKLETTLTAEMIRTGAWKDTKFKKTNLNAAGQFPSGGHLHPLLKVRAQFREILLSMGFNEMPTSKWVESSFWNFDALFQPQAHPARDAHDTFFLKNPASANHVPADYMERVRNTHENGLENSFGYGPGWSGEETMKNILRTHTTAVSSQMLYNQAQELEFQPMKYFSIDRVFRNETLDATHLAEFHQVEGVVVDRGISLGNLLGVMKEFFDRIGITNLKYKPAFNPYTEPSLEIFGFHPQLNRWIEIGNSGVFRPEMLEPMGLPKDVSVIAWGLSLERPTMIYYNVKNIRDLYRMPIAQSKKSAIAYIQGVEKKKAVKKSGAPAVDTATRVALDKIEAQLMKQGSSYLGGKDPSKADREMSEAIKGTMPSPASHPATFAWCALVSRYAEPLKASWK